MDVGKTKGHYVIFNIFVKLVFECEAKDKEEWSF